MERAIAAFLEASGLSLDDLNLRQTPERVAEAWLSEFLEGYSRTPEDALGETYPAPRGSSGELVVITQLRFHSMCPHHLLPYQGRVHVAYAPSKRIVGFGKIASLVDCFAHRLILQEDMAREIAAALARILKSPATACVIEAEQSCLRIRGDHQRDAVTHAEAYEGLLKTDRTLRSEFWSRVEKAR